MSCNPKEFTHVECHVIESFKQHLPAGWNITSLWTNTEEFSLKEGFNIKKYAISIKKGNKYRYAFIEDPYKPEFYINFSVNHKEPIWKDSVKNGECPFKFWDMTLTEKEEDKKLFFICDPEYNIKLKEFCEKSLHGE